MPKAWSLPPAVVITALTAFMGGGLAGSVFSWLVNRREPTIVTYSVNQTQLADPTASALIPDLSVNVGKESIHELHAYTIELDVPQGARQDHAQVGVFFSRKVRIYGKSTEAPSQLYSINCSQLDNGLSCQISPLARANNKPYRIVLATDEREPPHVEVAVVDAEVLSAADYVARKSGIWDSIGSPKGFGLAGLLALLSCIALIQAKLLKRIIPGAGGGIVVGKIVNQEGHPIAGAEVEVALESPNHNFSPTSTDRFGDFILGGLRKMSLYKGRVRISHPDYVSLDTQIESPIVSLKLDRSPNGETMATKDC